MPSRLLADLVVVLHLGFILFSVLGGLFVLRRPRMAWIHVPAVAWAAWVEISGRDCPLTPLETMLRLAAGGVAYEGGFVDRYLAPIVYPGPLTRQEQVLLGIAVVAVNAVIYVFVLFRRKAVARAFGGPARAPGPFGALGAVLPRSPFWAAIAVESGVVLVALALGSLMGYPPLHQIQLEGRGLLWGIGAVLPVALAVILASHRRLAFAVRLLDTLEDTLQPLLAGSVGRLAVISAVAGVGEEALFRGVVQSAAGAALGPWGGLLVASLFFGAAHLVSRTYAVMAMGFGLYLGWLLIVFDNLLVPIVGHAVYDFVLLLHLRRSQAGRR